MVRFAIAGSTDANNQFASQGKRKKSSRQPQGPRKREPLATTFACLFCNHENSVVVKLDKKLGLGDLSCKVCGQKFQTGINYLSAAVDVYSDWVDACDAVAKDTANQYDGAVGSIGNSKSDALANAGHGDAYEDDDDY
ncbi:Transcription elongation factor [Penicillium daleae]|uniref:Transcription elongation factor 1 homolog n=1 Tax=Penicillium daleae TaxID=63821 RepID=A0AAD6G002_9EURO|nr:Transcription elongation factor [Penicillium daleae]KAJ5443622.1 Transcription elongation factor [Penicillium daleae]